MRRYLLTMAALLGLAAGGTAQAATFAPTDPGYSSGASGVPKYNPEPGKIIVRLGGLVSVDLSVVGTDADNSHVNNAKNQAYGMSGYFRLYFGVDGKMTNGLIYGTAVEMRTNFAGNLPPGYTGTNALGNASANSTASTWYTRRAYVYVGGDQFGIFRIGQGDGPLGILNGNSTGEFYDQGNLNGSLPNRLSTSAALMSWFMPAGSANEYASNKIVWISPKFYGFTLGASFAPSSAALSATGDGTAIGGTNQRQLTSSVSSDVSRPRDIYEIVARYQGSAGPVGVDGMLGYSGSGVVQGATGFFPTGGVSKYHNLNVYDAGLTLSYVGFQLFGHITGGDMNGTFTPRARLTSGRSADGLAWTTGLAYGQGPWIVGASYIVNQSQGSNGTVGTGTAPLGNRRETAVNVGGTYTVTPGLDLYLEYAYMQRHQLGVNFRDGSAGPAANSNTINTNVLLASIFVRW